MEKDETNFAIVFKNSPGRPRAFKTEEEFQNAVYDYCSKCDKYRQMVNRSGFCSFANITRDTYYKQKQYYPETFEIVEQLFEDRLLNTPINQTLAVMALANHHKYSRTDKVGNSSETDFLQIADDEIEKRLKKCSLIQIEQKSEE